MDLAWVYPESLYSEKWEPTWVKAGSSRYVAREIVSRFFMGVCKGLA